MIDRRAMLAGMAASATVTRASAQTYRQAYPKLVFAHTLTTPPTTIRSSSITFVDHLRKQNG
jgi:hypothetical protein